MGGYAEDALLAGQVTRAHEDVDVCFPRDEQELRLAQLAELGFVDWETIGEAAPGVPFYLFAQNGELKVDLGVADEAGGQRWMRVHRLSFTVGGNEPQQVTLAQLRERFFPDRSEADLLPQSEPLPY